MMLGDGSPGPGLCELSGLFPGSRMGAWTIVFPRRKKPPKPFKTRCFFFSLPVPQDSGESGDHRDGIGVDTIPFWVFVPA
jgi:hypothetical protein